MNLADFTHIRIGSTELTRLTLDGQLIWQQPAGNLIPKAIDADGSIFNGTGYRDGCRLSSSGGLSPQENTFTTGFIPYEAGDVICMSGVSWRPLSSGYCYLMFFTEDFSVLGSVNESDIGGNYFRGEVSSATTIETTNGVTTFRPVFSSGKPAYFRINGYGLGADASVTVTKSS